MAGIEEGQECMMDTVEEQGYMMEGEYRQVQGCRQGWVWLLGMQEGQVSQERSTEEQDVGRREEEWSLAEELGRRCICHTELLLLLCIHQHLLSHTSQDMFRWEGDTLSFGTQRFDLEFSEENDTSSLVSLSLAWWRVGCVAGQDIEGES